MYITRLAHTFAGSRGDLIFFNTVPCFTIVATEIRVRDCGNMDEVYIEGLAHAFLSILMAKKNKPRKVDY